MPLALPAPNALLVLCERIARHRHLTGNVGSGGKRGGLDAGALALFVLARYLARRSLTWLLACLLTYMALTEHKSRRPVCPLSVA